jgi:hypothetical protein
MARPTKQGLDYFPVDCNPDGKLEMFIAENGAEGLGILILLWEMIYKDEGYFIKYDDDLIIRLRKEALSSMETIVNVIGNAVKRTLFDVSMLDNFGILTSKGIQKRFFPAAKQKKTVCVFQELLLLDVSTYGNLVITHVNPIERLDNTTKESKVKESRVKIGGTRLFVSPPQQETADWFVSKGSTAEEAGDFWHFYESKGWMVGKNKMKCWTSAAYRWIHQNAKNNATANGNNSNGTARKNSIDYEGYGRVVDDL